MSTPKPGSILIGSTRPDALRDWYRTALAPGHEGDGPIDLAGPGGGGRGRSPRRAG